MNDTHFKKLIDSKKLTRYKLHKISGVPITTIYRWYSGESNIETSDVRNFIKIADALNMTLDELRYELKL